AARNGNLRESGGEVGRQRSVLVRSFRNVQGQRVEIEIRLAPETLVDGREQLIAQAQVQGELGSDLPVVLGVACKGPLLRRDEVVGRYLAPVDVSEQEGGHLVAAAGVARIQRRPAGRFVLREVH